MSIFIADTSPLVAFSAVRRLDLLREVIPDLRIPPAVYRETVTEGQGWLEAAEIQSCLARGEWPLVQAPLPCDTLDQIRLRLGDGESEALMLGLELGVPVVIDDNDARKIAAKYSVDVIGTLGLLSRCKRLGLVH